MTATVALAGDTMLGRGVAQMMASDPTAPLVAAEVAAYIASADAFLLNLECCISARGSRFPDPGKGFFFRAPPVAAERLAELGVVAVTLANNHALDYGVDALLDTLAHLERAGVATVGAGADERLARRPLVVRCGGTRLRLVALSDHPAAYAAGAERPGIALAHPDRQLDDWLLEALRPGPDADAVLVTPHWGPNMAPEPIPRVRRAADALLAAGANLIAGHSAHVFQGVRRRVLFDLGDFLDDYAANSELRNDLGLLWLVEFDAHVPRRIQALPLALDYCFTRAASAKERDRIVSLLRARCAPFKTDIETADRLLEIRPDA